MGITHVFRGEDHLSNTWKHIDLFQAFGKNPPTYAHIPLILNPSGTKMSKRDEGAAVASYEEDGYLPDALFNYLCLLGWTPRTETEKLDRDALIQNFDAREIHSSNARFDAAKLNWFNAQYLRELSPEDLLAAARPILERAGFVISDEATAAAILQSVKEKIHHLGELPEWIHYFFRDTFPMEPDCLAKLKSKPENAGLLDAAATAFAALPDTFTEDQAHEALNAAAASASVKPGALMPLLRAAFSGQNRGPGVTTIAHLLGKEKVLARITQARSLI